MKHLFWIPAWILLATALPAQLNMSLLGHLDYQTLRNSQLSNLWGYTDEFGNEYALVGVNGADGQPNTGGFSVVDITDAANPVEVFFHPSANSIWREVKTWGDFAYVTTEAEAGLMIVDLSPLPQSTNLPVTIFQDPTWITSHSLFIDENGRLYIHGANRGNGGVIMYDLTQDPTAPVEVGVFDNWYVHDSYARGDTLYAGHIYDGFFSVVNVSDPQNPVLLGTRTTPNNFTHNTWLDDSGRYLFTTDERDGSFVGAYDLQDLTDIEEVDRLQSEPGSDAIPHNTYWHNGLLYTSYYTYGVAIYDATRPWNLVEVGNYDTSPFFGGGFHGAWGVYPFFPSGRIIISDIEEGLFILDAQPLPACWLEGQVTNAVTTAPVNLATVTIVGSGQQEVTAFDGLYATGYHTAGFYDVTVTAPGYHDTTITGVQLQQGQLTVLDIALQPLVPFAVSGQVVEQGSGTPIEGAQVHLESALYTYTTVSDANGDFTFPAVFAATYALTAGAWGWHTVCPPAMALSPNSPAMLIELPRGYRDDFALDLGWQVTGTAPRGMWERGTPVGTIYQGNPSNPGNDAPNDCGSQVYVTGALGGGAGDHDVDDGWTLLTSPVFDATTLGDPHVRFLRWFFNGGGSGNPNDELILSLSNGIDTVVLATITANSPGNSSWQQADFIIQDHLPATANMRLLAYTADDAPGHLVEAALDLFELTGTDLGIGMDETGAADGFTVFPNPAQERVVISWPGTPFARVECFDVTGRLMVDRAFAATERLELGMDLPGGAYVVRCTGTEGSMRSTRLVVE